MMRIFPLLWLIALFLVAAIVASAEAAAHSRFEIKRMIMDVAGDSDVPVSLALAVAKVESDFNAKALSSAGARGVMQIMPATARNEFGVSPKRLWDPQTNIRLGVRFLAQLHNQYDGRWDLALSHYNGGTVKGNQPHKYTRKYIKTVKKWQRVYQEQANLWENGQDVYEEKEPPMQFAEIREWRPRYQQVEDNHDYIEEDYDDNWGETRIIVVERDRFERRWHRPPPPPPFGRPHPRPYFH